MATKTKEPEEFEGVLEAGHWDYSMSPCIDKIAPALVAAQAEMPNPQVDGVNPHFRSKYATLGNVLKTAQPIMAKNGLALIQGGDGGNGTAVLETLILHKSGQWIRNRIPIVADKATSQGFGSALTYFRRYMAMAALGMAPEDDDAETATGRGRAASKPPVDPGLTEDQKTIKAILTRTAEKAGIAGVPQKRREQILEALGFNRDTVKTLDAATLYEEAMDSEIKAMSGK